jgi:hypothetical protein
MVDPLEIIAANKAVLGFNLIWLWDKVSEIATMLRTMMDKVRRFIPLPDNFRMVVELCFFQRDLFL